MDTSNDRFAPAPLGRRFPRPAMKTAAWLLAAGSALMLTFILVGSDVQAGPKPEQLQQPLPAGVTRLSLARLHARTLAIHHNELQARGRFVAYVYPPEVFADGIKIKAWIGNQPDAAALEGIAKELSALAEAIVSEARLAAGVPFDVDRDVHIELHTPAAKKPWIYKSGQLIRP